MAKVPELLGLCRFNVRNKPHILSKSTIIW